MRFVTFSHGSISRAGILEGEADDPEATVLDLAHRDFAMSLAGLAPQLAALVDAGLPDVVDRLRAVGGGASARLRLADVRLQAPLPKPRRIIAAAHNYRCALDERGMPYPREPVLFEKRPETVIGPGEAIVLPDGAGGCTYESELAVVIGRKAERVSPQDALAYVAGYIVFNDVSGSEIIRADGNFERGKNFPTFGPLGPFLASADEVADPQNLEISLTVDGDFLQRASTASMLFGIADLISVLSAREPLMPNDVIATGTPAGVAPVQNPPTWLRPGTEVVASVEGLGSLRNPVRGEAAKHG